MVVVVVVVVVVAVVVLGCRHVQSAAFPMTAHFQYDGVGKRRQSPFSVRALELLRLAFRPSPPPPSNTPCEHMYTHVNTRPPSGITLEHCPFAQTNTNQKGSRPTAISCSCRTAVKTRLPAWRRTRRPAHAARPGRRRSPRLSIAALYRCCVTVVCSTWASSLPGVALLVRCLGASASVSPKKTKKKPDRSFGPLVAGRGSGHGASHAYYVDGLTLPRLMPLPPPPGLQPRFDHSHPTGHRTRWVWQLRHHFSSFPLISPLSHSFLAHFSLVSQALDHPTRAV